MCAKSSAVLLPALTASPIFPPPNNPQEKEKVADDSKHKEKQSDEDSVDEEIRRLTANLATKRKPPVEDESQRAISALLEQTRKTQRGDFVLCPCVLVSLPPIFRRFSSVLASVCQLWSQVQGLFHAHHDGLIANNKHTSTSHLALRED